MSSHFLLLHPVLQVCCRLLALLPFVLDVIKALFIIGSAELGKGGGENLRCQVGNGLWQEVDFLLIVIQLDSRWFSLFWLFFHRLVLFFGLSLLLLGSSLFTLFSCFLCLLLRQLFLLVL